MIFAVGRAKAKAKGKGQAKAKGQPKGPLGMDLAEKNLEQKKALLRAVLGFFPNKMILIPTLFFSEVLS